MNTFLYLIGTYVLFALWQSTLWLAVAWILGRYCSRTPWKAHFLYVTGIFVATLTPLLSAIISATSGGLLQISVPQWIEPETPGSLCLAGTTLFAIALLYGISSSRKLMFHATPFPDRESQDALLRHSKTLRNVSLPILFTSPSVKSPTVWCWGLHPAVLLPESLADKLHNTERDAVFLHELSHIIRRDHLTSLFTRLCGAALFWNPLYWLVLWQSDLAADESCDLIVLEQGDISSIQYTDTLLRLVAGERSRPILQFLSRKERIMKRIDRIVNFIPSPAPIPSRLWTASVMLTALLLCITLAFCQEKKTLSPEQAMMRGYVEDYFQNNARDITMRKTLEWGEVKIDEEGNRTIRYKFEALIWDKDRIIFNSDFTFDKDGEYVSMVHVEGFPQPAEKPDVTTLEGVKKLVEKFFSQNFRDITSRKTVSWGELEKQEDGNVSLVYRYEATIGDKDKIVDERRFTFDNDGKVKSWERTEGFPKPIGNASRERNAVEQPVTKSLTQFLYFIEARRIDKRLIDFPDKFDLSTPESAYATQKHLIVSNADDKFEKLMKMQFMGDEVPERERRALSERMSDEFVKKYKTEFIVYEVLKIKPDIAFVFALRTFDNLYDGNLFRKKDDGLWYNLGNFQACFANQIVEQLEQTGFVKLANHASRERNEVERLEQQQAERIRSYAVGKRVTEFPEGSIDLLTPEAAYALGNRIMGDDNADKIERLRQSTAGMKIPQEIEQWVTTMTPEVRALMMNAEILHVFNYRDKHAMVIAEVVKGETYNNRLLSKRDGHWLNVGGGGLYKGASAEEVVKVNEGLFTKLADGWDNETKNQSQNPEAAQNTSPAPLASWEDEIDPTLVPKIVKMFPENGAKNVDPNISQVYLTFDLPMGDGRAWASNTADGTALDHDPDQNVFWTADQLTCVAPVKLQPNKRYVVYLNIRPFIGFASLAGVPSAGLTYSFETGPEPLDPERRKELAKNLFEQPDAVTKKKGWSPEQATGQPDAYRFKTGGDYPLAWASLTPDDQEEWLELTWDKPVEAVGVDVYETFNPGALVRVVAFNGDTEVAKWEGVDPTPRDVPNGKGISKIRFEKPVSVTKIRLYLDSANVPGWNEIDAVGLVDPSDAVHWATGAMASSTYAEPEVQKESGAAPVVVKFEPTNGAADVDAATVKELRVTFDVDMSTEGYSWCGGGETFPQTTGNAKWIDKRTCVLPVELEPGKKYLLGINAPSFKNFQSEAGVSVVPVEYSFSTKK